MALSAYLDMPPSLRSQGSVLDPKIWKYVSSPVKDRNVVSGLIRVRTSARYWAGNLVTPQITQKVDSFLNPFYLEDILVGVRKAK